MSKGIMNRRDKMIWDNSALPTIDDVTGQISDLAESVAGDLEDAYEELDDKIDQAILDCTYTAGTNIEIDEDNVISSTLTAGDGIVVKNSVISLTEDSYNAVTGLSYSTAPKKIGGKWIDNNDIFKITVNVGTLPNATTAIIAHAVSGINNIIKWEAIAMGSTLYADFVDMVTVDNTNINIDTGSVDMSGYTGYVTIYYTLKKQFAKLSSSTTSFDGINYWWFRIVNNTNYDSWVGMYRASTNNINLAILSKEQTSGLTVASYTLGVGGSTRGSGNLVCNSNYNNNYYTTHDSITEGTDFTGGNNAGIQVIFNSLSDLLSAFYN